MSNCKESFARSITTVLNFLFLIIGLTLLGIGLVMYLKYNDFSDFFGVWKVPIIVILIGCVEALFGFLGFCGAIKGSRFMIWTYIILLVMLLIAEFGLAIAGVMKHSGLRDVMRKEFNSTMEQYPNDKYAQDLWWLAQTEFSCCGTYGPSDWEPILHNSTLPASCCSVIQLDEASECTIKHAHPEGCFEKLYAIYDNNVLILVGVALGMAIIQLLAVVFACCLSSSLSRRYETV